MTSMLLSSEWMALTLKGLVLFVLGGAFAMSARRSSAAVRHGIWKLTLASALTLPVLSVCMPAVNVPVLPAGTPRVAVSEQPPTTRPAKRERSHVTMVHAGHPRHVLDASTAGASRLPSKHGAWAWQAVVLLWSVGTACFATKLLIDAWRVDRAARRMLPLPGVRWKHLIHALAERAGIKASVRIGLSTGLSAPITWGLRRPVILLPLGAEYWPDDRRRVVLLHELAHIQRRDHVWNLLGFLSLGLHWLNPLAWYAYRQLAIERERAADDWVLRTGVEGCDYASHLLALVRDLPRLRLTPWPASTMANGGSLRRRLQSLLDDRIPRSAVSTRTLLTVIPVAIALVGTLAPIHLSPSHARDQVITVEPSRASSTFWRLPSLGFWLGRGGEPGTQRSTLIPPLGSVIGGLASSRDEGAKLIPTLESVLGGLGASDDKGASLIPPVIWARAANAHDTDEAPADPAATARPTKEEPAAKQRGGLLPRLPPIAWRLGALRTPETVQNSAASHEHDGDPPPCSERPH